MFIHDYQCFGTTSDEEWYVAAFKQPTKVNDVVDIRNWCYSAFGEPGFNHLTHQYRWKDNINYGEVYFSSKEDLLMFKLGWS